MNITIYYILKRKIRPKWFSLSVYQSNLLGDQFQTNLLFNLFVVLDTSLIKMTFPTSESHLAICSMPANLWAFEVQSSSEVSVILQMYNRFSYVE